MHSPRTWNQFWRLTVLYHIYVGIVFMMKSIFLALCLVLMSGVALATKPFQGKVIFTFSAGDSEGTITMFTKGQKVRMDPALKEMEQNVWMVMNNASKEITLVMPDQSMYMTLALDMAKKMAGATVPGLAAEGKRFEKKPTPTGKTKTILGHECHQYIYNDDGDNIEMWVAHTVGTFPEMMGVPIPQYIGKEDFAFFPLEISGKDKDGKIYVMKVTELSTNVPSDDTFTPPSSYQKLSMGVK